MVLYLKVASAFFLTFGSALPPHFSTTSDVPGLGRISVPGHAFDVEQNVSNSTRFLADGVQPWIWKMPKVRKIFYINLADSTDRRAWMEHTLDQASEGIPWERWEAVNKTEVMRDERYQKIIRERGLTSYLRDAIQQERMPGVIACYMSHLMLLHHVAALSSEGLDELYIIAEDDTNITRGWQKTLARTWLRVPEDWDLLRIGYRGENWPCDLVANGVLSVRLPGGSSRGVGCNRNYLGTQAYIVSPRRAFRVLDFLAGSEIRDVDTLLCTGLLCGGSKGLVRPNSPGVVVYALADVRPYFLMVEGQPSTIGIVNRSMNDTLCLDFLSSPRGMQIVPGEPPCRGPRRKNVSPSAVAALARSSIEALARINATRSSTIVSPTTLWATQGFGDIDARASISLTADTGLTPGDVMADELPILERVADELREMGAEIDAII